MKKINYLELNERAFDFLAERYSKRANANSINPLIEIFSQSLLTRFRNPNVLEIGCGSGFMLRYFSEEDFRTIAIDISSEMIWLAKRKSPYTTYIHSDFLEHDFSNERFSGVFADSSLQLFPKEKTNNVFDKIYSILEEQGLFYLSVPLFDKFEEEIVERESFIPVYRVRYTQDEFNKFLEGGQFNSVKSSVSNFVDSQGNHLFRLNSLLSKC